MRPEFDGYGQDYRRLLQHPIRDRFAPSADYFARRKLEVIRAFFARRGIGWLCVVEHNPWNPVTRYLVRRSPVDQGAELLSAGGAASLLSDNGFGLLDRRYFLVVPERLRATFGAWEDRLSGMPVGGQYAVFAHRAGEATSPAAGTGDAKLWAETRGEAGPRQSWRKS